MSILARKIEKISLYADAAGQATLDAVREFLPRSTDKSGLSVYEFANIQDPLILQTAAAFLFSSGDPIKPFYFAIADRADVDAAGFEVRSTKGETGFEKIDKLHRDIVVTDWSSIERLSKIFFIDNTIVNDIQYSPRETTFALGNLLPNKIVEKYIIDVKNDELRKRRLKSVEALIKNFSLQAVHSSRLT